VRFAPPPAAKNSPARQATLTQNSKSSAVQGVSDARCRPRRGPQSKDATQNSRSSDVRKGEPKPKHTHKATHRTTLPTQTSRGQSCEGVESARPRRRPRRGWSWTTRPTKTPTSRRPAVLWRGERDPNGAAGKARPKGARRVKGAAREAHG
jgi:hypothetical protein